MALAFCCGMAACNSTKTPPSDQDLLNSKIDSLEQVFFGNNGALATPHNGLMLVREYARYYQLEEKVDSLAVDRIFKAGEISMGIGQGNLAVKYFQTVVEDHPEFYKASEALFLCGFCEETLNSDTAKARQYYESFVRQFPQHRLAQDAKFSVENLGLSDEELIERFEKANQQGS